MSSFWFDAEAKLSSVCEDPKKELSLLCEAVAGIPSDRFLLFRLTDRLPDLSEGERAELSSLIARRCGGEPLQYLLGAADFYGRSFVVRPGVLIPRFDTEILVDTALSFLKGDESVLDLCAGSGCIGLTLGAEKGVFVTSVEKFPEAFGVLSENRERIYPPARLILGDVLTDSVEGEYDLIVSNPPYIPTEDIPALSREVLQEPGTALDGGPDGFLFYRALIARYAVALKPGGVMLFECGIGQAEALERLFLLSGFTNPFRVKDYGGIERVVGARKSREVSHV